ncbi:hypothetical protein BK025_10730 [Sodalis sp. TME1]|nr:hypothetical protein BK025_10730 [Sodalis sp. TME1]
MSVKVDAKVCCVAVPNNLARVACRHVALSPEKTAANADGRLSIKVGAQARYAALPNHLARIA